MNHLAIRKGNVAVVTGAAAGIGFAIAQRLAKEGMDVVLFDLDAKALQSASEMITADFPDVKALALLGDVTSEHDLHSLYEKSCEFGKVSLLINNAATIKGAGPWDAPSK